jgi:hypothetical protein
MDTIGKRIEARAAELNMPAMPGASIIFLRAWCFSCSARARSLSVVS